MFSDPTFNNGGRLSGTFSGSSLTLVLGPSDPDSCPLNVTATVSPNGNQITGSYASFECSEAVTGSLNLMKQFFVFLDRADVEATNYPAEQDIRIAVVNRKTCGGGNRTAKGAQAQSILMSVLQSCRHKGIRVIDIVTSILRAPDNTPVPLVGTGS